MRVNGLTLTYKDGLNTVSGPEEDDYPVGDILCRTFQEKTLNRIICVVRDHIIKCPMHDSRLTPDEIEKAESYITEKMLCEDFYPARCLAQGCFIDFMEKYRALDSKGNASLLLQEELYAMPHSMYLERAGFRTVGEFLRLCFNRYLDDLEKGMDIFRATSAVWSGTADEREQALYDKLCWIVGDEDNVPGIEMQISYNWVDGSFRHSFEISSFIALAVFEFSHLSETGVKILRCQNPACRKFFTAKRVTAKYCGFAAPQSPGQSCADYYPQIVYREKVRSNELDRLIRNAKGRLYNARRRHSDQVGDIEKRLSDLTIYAPTKKNQVLEGTMSKNEFREWLNSH